jgi:hypothetical protein
MECCDSRTTWLLFGEDKSIAAGAVSNLFEYGYPS